MALLLAAILGFWSAPRLVTAADDPPAKSAADADAEKQRQIAERFLTVLEKSPRRGTALDRLYGYHVETGSLEDFVKGFRERTATDPQDGAAWMILGLVEAQRGHDASAVKAFESAEKAQPDNSLASYYLGQSLVLVGQPEEAAAAFERAISKKPQRADLLDMFQALGRVYQRAQKGDKALEVWGRLEKLFPDDLRVQEQIASTLVEEGQHEQALPRFEALIKQVKDEYRAATWRIEAAEIKVRLGRPKEALADFEALLSRLNPDNWLYRDVRRRVDEVFLRNDDQAGLAAYYEGWLDKNADDVEGMTRLAKILAGLGRTPEAQTWLDKALKLAPSRKDLRLAYIEELLANRNYPLAITQYEVLAKNDPNNPDYLREWGKLILKDASKPENERKRLAAAVWKRQLEARPKDSLVASQVADLFRQSEMVDEAIALYKKAIELSPSSAQYREYLGEYLHTLKRGDEALAVWREIAAGKKRTAQNLARLAEVLSGFGYLDEAITNIQAACTLDDREFKYPLKAAELLSRGEKYDAALQQLDAAAKLADSAEDSETVLQQRVRNLQLADALEREIEALQTELQANDKAAERWYVLARYLEAAHKLPEATQAINKALALEERSVPYRTASAKIEETAGNLQGAADAYRTLATIDRRFRTEHLTSVAKLEAQLGRTEQALQAGRDLLAAAPGNPENYEFFSQLCFQLGKVEEGLDALRRSVRLNPTEPKAMLTLAAALAEQFRTDEAIELYWRAFEKSADLDGKLGIVPKLAEMYLQTNHFEKLIERLERERREANREREMTICLAQAYQAAGDYGTARQELERLLAQNARDTQLLQQLAKLAESEGDVVAAVKYQQQLVAVAPGKESQMQLAQLLMKTGETDEASAVWVKLTADEDDPEKVLRSVDSLLAHEKRDTALTIIGRLLREQPQNWELLYREAAALMADKPEAGAARFKAILALHLPDDDLGVQARNRVKQAQSRVQTASSARNLRNVSFPLQERSQAVYQIRQIVGLDNNRFYSGQTAFFWGPNDFGQARMAAIAWLLRQAEKQNETDQFVTAMQQELQKPSPDAREEWDWYYLQLVRQNYKEIHEAARRLSRSGDPLAQILYLSSLSSRHQAANQRYVANQNQADTTPPLPGDELDYVLACYKSVQQKRPDLLDDGNYIGMQIANSIAAELKRAQRTDEEAELYKNLVAAAEKPAAIMLAAQMAATRNDLDGALALFDKWEHEQLAQARRSAPGYGYYGSPSDSLGRLMNERSEAGAHGDVLKILDRYLSFSERQFEVAANSAKKPARQVSRGGPYGPGGMYINLWIGKAQRGIQIDYPQANEYFDYGAILLLRTAYELYKAHDLVSDLSAHLKLGAETGPEDGRLWRRLGLAYVAWWSDEKSQAAAELEQAVSLAPNEGLKNELASLYEKQHDFESALKVVEAMTALDHVAMQQKETTALRLAVRTGDVDRARLAAERLFGLRIDAETQVQLAAEMRQLGMHEQAEAVLARARRQAGNRIGALVSLMTQYQAEQKPELAVQVAHQILRRGSPASPGPNRVYREEDAARPQALQVLARSGRLKDLIERAEAQLKSSPESTYLFQTLTEYYQAAGDQTKALDTLKRMAELRPDDARLQYQIAQQYTQSGKPAEAVAHYRAALKKEPALFNNNYWQVQQAFQQAQKQDELVALLDEMDLKQTGGQYWSVMNIVQNMMQQENSRPAALKLFRKAWQAFPESRQYLVGSLYNDELWKLPEVVNYAREALIPGDSTALGDPWNGVSQIMSYSGDGKVNGALSRLVEGAARQNFLPALQKEVEDGLKKQPAWLGGKAMLAVIYARSGKPELARPIIEGLLADKKNPIPTQTCWIIGQELEDYDATRPLAVALYESTLDQQDNSGLEYSYSPSRRLVTMYRKAGSRVKARELVLKLARRKDDERYRSNPGYAEYRRLSSLSEIGRDLVELGYPADAVQLFGEVIDDEATIQAAQQWGGDYYVQRARQSYEQAQKALTPQALAQALGEFLTPRAASASGKGPAVELMLHVHPRDLSRAEVSSMVANAVRDGAAAAEQRAGLQSHVTALLKEHADDFSVQVVAAIAALGAGQKGAIDESLQRLQQEMHDQPLESLPPGTRANARQRAQAEAQVPLWLVARECLKVPERRAAGEKLAERALEAARRQTDSKYLLAILREWGQIAFDQGDKKSAEARWTEMLKLVLPAAPAPKAPPAAPAVLTPKAASLPSPPGRGAGDEGQIGPRPSLIGVESREWRVERTKKHILLAALYPQTLQSPTPCLSVATAAAVNATSARDSGGPAVPSGRPIRAATRSRAMNVHFTVGPSSRIPTEAPAVSPGDEMEIGVHGNANESVPVSAIDSAWRGFLSLRDPAGAEHAAAHAAGPPTFRRISAVTTRSERHAQYPRELARTLAFQTKVKAAPAPAPARKRPAASSPTPGQPGPASGRPLMPPATLTQFNQAAEIARLAADHDMHELSLRAVRDALKAGPPVKELPANEQFGMGARPVRRSRNANEPDELSQISQQVCDKLSGVIDVWNRAQVPAADQFEVLATALLPEGRPSEIFLYSQALTAANLKEPRSLARLAAQAAIKAGRVDEFRARIDKRLESPLAQLPGKVLLARLAFEAGDQPLTRAQLESVAVQLKGDASLNAADLACHVALPALDFPELGTAALPIVEAAAERYAAQSQNDEPAASLLLAVGRHHLRAKDVQAARKSMQQYLDACQKMNVRYSGDYGSFRLKQQVQQVATEYAQSGLFAETLEMLGQFADMPDYPYGDPSVGTALAHLRMHFAKVPVEKRYEILKDWTLPAGNRQAVRLLAAFRSADHAPTAFHGAAPNQPRDAASGAAASGPTVSQATGPAAEGHALSTAGLLIDAARELGRLDELAAAAQEPAAKNLDKAQSFLQLVNIARGNNTTELALRQRVAEYPNRFNNPNPQQRRQALHWDDYLLATACAAQPGLRDAGEQYLRHLIEHAKRTTAFNWLSVLNHDLAAAIVAREQAAIVPGGDPGLKLWHPAVHDSAGRRNEGGIERAWWLVHEDHVVQVSGPNENLLYFDYPLAGEFDFSMEGPMRSWDEANPSYGGIVFEALHGGAPTLIWPVGHHESLSRPDPLDYPGEFSRVRLEVRANRVRCVVNDHLAYELADPSPTSPWLALYAGRARKSPFRNLSLAGDVRIPREVRLTHGDRLEGWISNYYGGNMPPRLTLGEPLPNNAGRVERNPRPTSVYSWSATDGVIFSRVGEPGNPVPSAESRLYYHRPLRPAEMLRYEFFYEPGKKEVHPALDRLAFILDPAGVRQHWMTDVHNGVDCWSGIPERNLVDEPQYRRGPAKLPLKPGAWNAVRISLVSAGAAEVAEFSSRPSPRGREAGGEGNEGGLDFSTVSASANSGGPAVPTGRPGRAATRSRAIDVARTSSSVLQTSAPNDKIELCPGSHSVDCVPLVVTEPAWRGFLSLRDPAGAEHAAGPPEFGVQRISDRQMAATVQRRSLKAELQLVLELNGVEIYRRPVEPDNDRLFGFYHRAGETVAEIKNVVLTGDWPEKLGKEQLANLVALEQPLSDAARQANHDIVDESYFLFNWEHVQKRARSLPAAERYAYLRDWVLPSADHPAFRFNGGYTPTNPPVPRGAPKSPADPAAPRRVNPGGEMTAPVLDLVEAARETNKLDDLAGRVLAVQPVDEFGQRGKWAMLVLIALAQKNEDAAGGYLQNLRMLVGKDYPDDSQHYRWPELIAAWACTPSAELRPLALEILNAMVDQMQKHGIGWDWELRLRPTRDRARYLSLPEAGARPFRSDPPAKQWSRVAPGKADTRGKGYPQPHWQTKPGEVQHFTGHDHDYLYFSTPLRGNFEVNCQLTTFGWRECQVSYGGTWVGVRYTRKGYELSHYGRNEPDGAIEPELPDLGQWYDYRLVIQDGTYTAYINGTKIHQQALAPEPDPWLAIHSSAQFAGGCRNLRITGNPTIPEQLDLSNFPDLIGWVSDYYNESVAGEAPDWKKEGEEIVGRQRTDLPAGVKRQSLLRYHRPLLEDGEIEFEFFYEPGKTAVFPALDRLALVLDPAGVKTHWITDAQFERTGVPHDNVSDEAASRRGPQKLPLKPGDWNRVKLSLTGDVLSLALNGTEIFQRPLEPTNQRIFGLFHYVDETSVRVRHVSYRGNWPRKLPPVSEQELAQ